MSSPFQWIIDNAVDVSVNKRAIVAQTISRDQTIRATSRGGRIWRFTVTPSPGMRWSESRAYIEAIDKADRISTTTIKFNTTGMEYVFGYQGDVVTPTGMTGTYTQGSDQVGISGHGLTSGYIFKGGDLIQFGSSPRVYSVVGDVAWNATTLTVNRPVLETSGSATLKVGTACEWTVICSQLPNYAIVEYDRIEWDGSFIFMESLA